MKRYVFLSSTEYSAHCLKTLLEMNINEAFMVLKDIW